MSKVTVPTIDYVNNKAYTFHIECPQNVKTIEIDLHNMNKTCFLLMWSYNNWNCLYAVTVNNAGATTGSYIDIQTIFKASEAELKTLSGKVVSATSSKITVEISSTVTNWDAITVIAPCKASGRVKA